MATLPDAATPEEPQLPLPVDDASAPSEEPKAPSEVPGATPLAPDTPSEPAAAVTETPPPLVTSPQAPDAAVVAREQAVAQREQEAATQQAAFETQRKQAKADNDIRAYQAELEGLGLQAPQVHSIVERERTLRQQIIQAEGRANQQVEFFTAQRNAALYYSNEYGIAVNDLISMATPQEMEAAGKVFAMEKTSREDIAAFRKELAEIKQAQVPADQKFSDGQGGRPEQQTQFTAEQIAEMTPAEYIRNREHIIK